MLCVVVLPILLLALPFLAVGAWLDGRKRRRLQRGFHNRWGGQGKRLLLVYSNSPTWQAYVEGNWLPQLESIAVVLNWSERGTWAERHPFEADIFRTWAGDREFKHEVDDRAPRRLAVASPDVTIVEMQPARPVDAGRELELLLPVLDIRRPKNPSACNDVHFASDAAATVEEPWVHRDETPAADCAGCRGHRPELAQRVLAVEHPAVAPDSSA